MPTAQFDFRVDPGRASTARPMVSLSAADAVGAGYAAFGKTMQTLGATVNETIKKHVDKTRRLEMQADDAAFQAFAEKTRAELEMEAQQTGDKDEIAKIYARYPSALRSYIDGKSESGAPNLRWKDHQDLLGQHLPAFEMQAEAAKNKRLLAVSVAESAAKFDGQITEGIRLGNHDQVAAGVAGRMEALGKGPEETKVMLAEKLLAVDMNNLNNRVGVISSLEDPEEARRQADELLKSVGDKKAFRYLNDAERGKYVGIINDAAAAPRKRMEERNKLEEVDFAGRFQKAVADGETINGVPVYAASAELIETKFGKIPDRLKADMIIKKAKEAPVPTVEDYTYFSEKIAALKPDDKVGWMKVRREMESRGLKPETEKPLFDMMGEILKPVDGTEKFTEQYANEKAKFIKEMAEANDKSKFFGSLVPGPVDEKGNLKDKTTEYAALLARELDSMNSFVSERSKKVGYSQAITEFWEQPHVKEMRDKNNIRVMIDRVTDPAASAKKTQQIDSALNTLTNRTTAVQSSLYVQDEDMNSILGIK